jgi:hypothetical protein
MRTRMKTIISGAVLGLALMANSVPSWAGATTVLEVTVSPGQGASGAVSAARYSNDTSQSIGCYTTRTPSTTYIVCNARDKNSAAVACITSTPILADMADAISNYSFVYFTVGSGSSCSSMFISNSSAFLH